MKPQALTALGEKAYTVHIVLSFYLIYTCKANRFDLSDRIAFITGASKGIGLAIARGMAEHGAHVVVSSRKREAIDKVTETYSRDGLKVTGLTCHMGKSEEIEQALDETVRRLGRLDIVVNNAATNPYYGPIEEAGEDVFDKLIDTNVKGPFLLSKLAFPYLKSE